MDRSVSSGTNTLWRRLGLGYCALLAAAVLLPVVVVVLGAFVPAARLGLSSEQWVAGDEGWLSLKWFAYVLDLYSGPLLYSLGLAVFAVVGGTLLAVPAAYGLVRYPFPGAKLVEELALLPLAVPGIAVAIALIQTYALARGEWWFVGLGHLLYTVPLLLRTLLHALRGEGFELERAAATLGAGPWQRFRLVTWPRLARAASLGALIVAAVSWGEFNASFLLATPLHQPYPAALYATYTSNSFAVSSAATTLFLAVILPLLLLIERLGRDELMAVRQGA
ncbi:MAG TPA: ABC transporter permease subunit [Thermoanaerobaculia bacterium]|nr:ABC transporter permease subunit [Thermoanaerobaculia bacterium]